MSNKNALYYAIIHVLKTYDDGVPLIAKYPTLKTIIEKLIPEASGEVVENPCIADGVTLDLMDSLYTVCGSFQSHAVCILSAVHLQNSQGTVPDFRVYSDVYLNFGMPASPITHVEIPKEVSDKSLRDIFDHMVLKAAQVKTDKSTRRSSPFKVFDMDGPFEKAFGPGGRFDQIFGKGGTFDRVFGEASHTAESAEKPAAQESSKEKPASRIRMQLPNPPGGTVYRITVVYQDDTTHVRHLRRCPSGWVYFTLRENPYHIKTEWVPHESVSESSWLRENDISMWDMYTTSDGVSSNRKEMFESHMTHMGDMCSKAFPTERKGNPFCMFPDIDFAQMYPKEFQIPLRELFVMKKPASWWKCKLKSLNPFRK